MPKKKAPSERAYARLTRHERQAIEGMPDRGKGRREIAREIGRAPSTVANEAERHRESESTPIPFTLPHAATAAPFRFLASNSSGLR